MTKPQPAKYTSLFTCVQEHQSIVFQAWVLVVLLHLSPFTFNTNLRLPFTFNDHNPSNLQLVFNFDASPSINMVKTPQKEGRHAAGKRRGRAALPGKIQVTYPYWMRLGVLLEMQNPYSGKNREQLETTFLSQGAGRPQMTGVAPLPGIDVEKLSEEEIKELETNWASGRKIEYIFDRETGKEEPHVLMHSLTPNLMNREAVAKEEQKKSDDSPSGQRTEVNICYKK